ncbi:MAG: tetratricopeptide repeat protein [Planctomycetes bacterium]|nr:tetratricopeptide repeat protein [Planctomycetota bacterium]
MEDDLITPSDFFHRGLESLENGRYSEAVKFFEQAVKNDYYDADIHLPMGEALFEVGRYQDALDHFELAQKKGGISPNEVLLWRGSCYLELKKVRRALSAFNRVIEADPNHAEAHFKRGLALCEIQSFDRALEAFESAERLLRRITGTDDGPHQEALAEVLMWKGRTLCRLGRRADAMALLLEAWEMAPDHPGPYNELADSFRFTGDLGSAEEWYKKGLERLPDDPSLHNDYGNLLRELGRLRESVQHLTTAIEQDANRAVAYYNRALTLERLELFDEALKDYDSVIDANPGDLDAKLRKLDLLGQMGLFTEAEELLRSLGETELTSNETREARARLANRRAQKAEVENDLHHALMFHGAALSLHPDFLDVESPAPDDDRAEDRIKRLLKLVSRVPAESPEAGLAALLEGAARFVKLRLRRNENTRRGVKAEREKVRALLTRAVDAGAAPAAAHKLLAELAFYEFKDDDLALKHADAALNEHPDFVGALWIKAVTLGEGKLRPDLAVECYRRMLEITPNNPSVLLNLGDLYFDHGQPHRALSYYRRVLEDRPGDVSVHRDVGHCYLALQRYGDAIAVFARLEAEGALALELKLDLAEAHLAVGERVEAEKQVEQVQLENEQLDPQVDARAFELAAAVALSRRNAKQARKLLAGVEHSRLTTYGLLQLARADIQLENLSAAEKQLKEITESLDPHAADAVEARYHLARIAFARADHERANELLDELLAAAPLDERAYRMKAWIFMLNGELEQADDVKEAARFAVQIAKVHRLLQYEEYGDAITQAEALAQDYPSRIEPLYYRACALAQQGEDDASLEIVKALLKRAPDLKPRVLEEFYLEPLRLADRIEFRSTPM